MPQISGWPARDLRSDATPTIRWTPTRGGASDDQKFQGVALGRLHSRIAGSRFAPRPDARRLETHADRGRPFYRGSERDPTGPGWNPTRPVFGTQTGLQTDLRKANRSGARGTRAGCSALRRRVPGPAARRNHTCVFDDFPRTIVRARITGARRSSLYLPLALPFP